jgi:predicted acetyltransferase
MVRALVAPTSRLHRSWLDSWDEWGRGVSQPGASLRSAERKGLDLENARNFAQWVEELLLQADPTRELPADMVPATNLWVVEDGRYCGAIQLRHRLTPRLATLGGHVGYSVRPSARLRGHAAFALRGVLPRAARLGLDRVLVTCDDDNVASHRTVERAGGVLEDVREPDEHATAMGFATPIRRYWIAV